MTQLYGILGLVSVLLLLSVFASKAAVRIGVPTLLLFLALGMVAGSEGVGGVWFDYPRIAQGVGVVALAYILYAAGLSTNASDFRRQMWPALSLSTVGVLVSCAAVATFSRYVLGRSWSEGALLGAVVSATDAAAVFSILRAKGTNLKPELLHLIEAESGSNDPMAVFLTFAAITAIINPHTTFMAHVGRFALEMGLGAGIGYVGGRLIVYTINHVRLQSEGLYPVLSIALVCALFAFCATVKGNGFLAVYIGGLVVGNANLIHRRSLLLFHDGVAWLLQIAMFLILGLQVFPSQLIPVAKGGVYVSLFLILVARPLSVMVALAPFRFGLRSEMFLAWAGLRGAAPIILATFAVTGGVPSASTLFNTVFFVAVLSVAVQGTTIDRAARLLGAEDQNPSASDTPLLYDPTALPDKRIVEFEVRPDSPADGARVVDLQLPHGTLILVVGRGTENVVPNGSTVLRAGDIAQVLAEPETLSDTEQLFKVQAKASADE